MEPIIPADLAPERASFSRRASLASSRSLNAMASLHSSSLLSSSSPSAVVKSGFLMRVGLAGAARRTLGIILLMVTVCLWTVSNFLASDIFSDGSYSKPFFVVYINSSIFAFSLIPIAVSYVVRNGIQRSTSAARDIWLDLVHQAMSISLSTKKLPGGDGTEADDDDDDDDDIRDEQGRDQNQDHDEDRDRDRGATERLLIDDEGTLDSADLGARGDDKLGFRETAEMSLEFCMLWFVANYFASACLEYTSVASATIFTSLSSMFTLILCALAGVEPFSTRKLAGVLASVAGVALISSLDLSGQSDEHRGNFPHKSRVQILIGDSMALLSAVIYGIYVTVMKRRVGDETRVNMPLFFGLVGFFSLFFLWPVLFFFHLTGIEKFELPSSGTVWVIIMLNSLTSFVSDISWAYSMLLTTPLIVTVGLSLTIPLSLVGEMIQYSQHPSWIYWVGAAIVVLSFLFINFESQVEEGGNSRSRPNGDAVV